MLSISELFQSSVYTVNQNPNANKICDDNNLTEHL